MFVIDNYLLTDKGPVPFMYNYMWAYSDETPFYIGLGRKGRYLSGDRNDYCLNVARKIRKSGGVVLQSLVGCISPCPKDQSSKWWDDDWMVENISGADKSVWRYSTALPKQFFGLDKVADIASHAADGQPDALIASCRTVAAAEMILIKYFGRRDNGTGILTNLTDGGEGVIGMSKSFNAALRKSLNPLRKSLAGDLGREIVQLASADFEKAWKPGHPCQEWLKLRLSRIMRENWQDPDWRAGRVELIRQGVRRALEARRSG